MRYLFRRRSLAWRLVSRFSGLLLLLALGMNVAFAAFVASRLPEGRSADYSLPALIGNSIEHRVGGLEVSPLKALYEARERAPDLWFVAVDHHGHAARFGRPPPQLAGLAARIRSLQSIEVRAPESAALTSKIVDVEIAGEPAKLFYGGKIDEAPILAVVLTYLGIFYGPALLFTVLFAGIVLPLIVNRSLRGLRRTAALAASLNLDSTNDKLPTTDIPEEVEPLVSAVNLAMARTRETMENRRRFLSDAAHELRTPIAILQTRLEALPDCPRRRDLLRDVSRLASVAEQLLDMERFAAIYRQERVDLNAVCERVVADLAPAAIIAGYDLELVAQEKSSMILGDATAIERALTNLVNNAIQHSGGTGVITVTLARGAVIEVSDEGSGIPSEDRERIFEPFYRLRPHNSGTGLGLPLVRQIARLHGGEVLVVPQDKGTRIRLELRS